MSLVSIIMPYYKKKSFFLESINSAINQTYKNTEIIIIYDDTDLTDLKYIDEIKKLDSRIRVIKNDHNIGAGLSRNLGILNSRGSYIGFLDCDDLWVSKKIEKHSEKIIEVGLSQMLIDRNKERPFSIEYAAFYSVSPSVFFHFLKIHSLWNRKKKSAWNIVFQQFKAWPTI